MAAGRPPARVFAGEKVGRDMRTVWDSTFRKVLLRIMVLAAFALSFASATPMDAFARPATTTPLPGDPDGGDLSPTPGPSKASRISVAQYELQPLTFDRNKKSLDRSQSIMNRWRALFAAMKAYGRF